MKRTLKEWRETCREVEKGDTGHTIYTDDRVFYSVFEDSHRQRWYVEYDNIEMIHEHNKPIEGVECWWGVAFGWIINGNRLAHDRSYVIESTIKQIVQRAGYDVADARERLQRRRAILYDLVRDSELREVLRISREVDIDQLFNAYGSQLEAFDKGDKK